MPVVTQLYFHIRNKHTHADIHVSNPLIEENYFTNPPVFSTATNYEAYPTKNGPTKATSKDDSSPRVDEPTEETTNKVVNIADSTSRICGYTPPQTL
jgi:hypothetical protein